MIAFHGVESYIYIYNMFMSCTYCIQYIVKEAAPSWWFGHIMGVAHYKTHA